MATDHIRYDLLAQEALRGVVHRVLADVAKNGLPGDHHFYITIDTRAPEVKISPRLREQYPETMTVVLQHQFWDLVVTNQGFEVGLSFKGVPERVVVPFTAIKGFFDPSVQFGLQFEMMPEAGAAAPPPPAEAPAAKADIPAPSRSARSRSSKLPAPAASLPSPAPGDRKAAADEADKPPPPPAGKGEVVRLDRFRKK